MVRALTTKQFIARAKRIHGDKFDYSRVYYDNNKTKIEIICSTHGSFWQTPNSHLRGAECLKCMGGKLSRIRSKGVDQFIRDAIRVHGVVYNYSKVKYINNRTKVIITCLRHGDYLQSPNDHINHKTGCPRCANFGYSKISIQFLNDFAREWKVKIQHAENGGEYKIEDFDFNCYYKADGYFELNNKKYIVEFLGDYFHGNLKIYKLDGISKHKKMTFGELYKKTMERMNRLKSLGYTAIYIWERDYKQYLIDRDNEYLFEGLLDYYKVL